MPSTFVIVRHRHTLFNRLLMLVFCLPFFLVGVYASGATVIAVVRWVFGTPIVGSIWYGVIIGLGFTAVGSLGLWGFFQPQDTLTFHRATRSATLVRLYPFGKTRRQVFGFDRMTIPEVVWVSDTDRSDGGYWALKVVLPSGMVLTKAHYEPDGQGKAKAQEWCLALLDVMRPQ